MAWMKTYFELSSGLAQPIKVPAGTHKSLQKHFEDVTQKLRLVVASRKDGSTYWNSRTPDEKISNDVAGKAVLEHNRFVRQLFDDLAKWSKSPPDEEYEELTPELARTIWYGFSLLSLTHDRWVEDVYVEEMEILFDVMQGHERDGIDFGEAPLSKEQAAAVIGLFSCYFDRDDVRLTLPNNRDFLVTTDDYYWCPSHGAWHWEDVEEANYNYESDEESDCLRCPADGCDEVIG